jgi:hypothetical protein
LEEVVVLHQGFIKLHRKIQDHWIYQEKRKFSRYEAWLDLLMSANHKDNRLVLGNEIIHIEKGSFVTSELKLMDRWDWGKGKLRTFLEMLENDGMIVKKSDRKKTTITICNYCIYHQFENENRPQTDHERTISGLSADTNKNVKNVKNVKNNTSRHKFEICDMEMAELLFQKMLANNENAKQPNLEAWANEVRLMREKDNRTIEQIQYLINWSQNDSFWKVNILSMSKLRSKFDQLVIRCKEDAQKKKTAPFKKSVEKEDFDLSD